MDEAKIQLSQEEMELVCNGEVLLTKQRIIEKVFNLFGELAALLQQRLHSVTLPDNIQQLSAKISKGENYQLLPYVMLDYPRYFSREDVLAIRTFFWWGNFFSVTLQLKGKYQRKYASSVLENQSQLGDAGFHLSVSDDEWRHDHATGHYRPVHTMNADEFQSMINHPFCKLSARIELTEWNNATMPFEALYDVLIVVLKD